MFSKERNKEHIVIKLMKDETSLKISLCSKPGSVTSNGYLKTSKAVGAVISPDNLSGYLTVTKIRMFLPSYLIISLWQHWNICCSVHRGLWKQFTSFILAVTFCLVSPRSSLLLMESVLELYTFVKVWSHWSSASGTLKSGVQVCLPAFFVFLTERDRCLKGDSLLHFSGVAVSCHWLQRWAETGATWFPDLLGWLYSYERNSCNVLGCVWRWCSRKKRKMLLWTPWS